MGAAVADIAATERPINLDLAKVIPKYRFSCSDNDARVKGTRTRLRSRTAWRPDLTVGR